MIANLIYHEKHASRWEQRGNINTLLSQRHNVGLAIKALEALNKEHGFDWKPGMFGIHPGRLGQGFSHQRPSAPPVRQVVHAATRPRGHP